MKKATSLSLSLAISLASGAQITITSADMPDANDSLFVSHAPSLGAHNPSETGANFKWDYSDLKPTMQQPQKFDAPGKFPSIYNLLFNPFNTSYGKNNFLVANVELPGVKIESAYDFFKESTSSLNQVGVGFVVNGTPLPFIYRHTDVQYKFPMNYLNQDSCNFDFGLALPGYGYYGQTGRRHNVVDGWGELKTPLGTYATLRIFSTVDITDTIYSEKDSTGFSQQRPPQYEYRWFAPHSKIPVLQIVAMTIANQSSGIATFIDTLRKDIIHLSVDESDQEQIMITVYPNPVQDQFRISYQLNDKSSLTITLTDILGNEMMRTVNEVQSAGSQEQVITVQDLPSGIYFVRLQSGNRYSVKKISIVH